MMSADYVKLRKKVRFNAIVASMFCFVAVALALIYGSSFFALYWTLGNIAISLASFGAASAVAVLILGFWLKLMLKMKAKLKTLDSSVPVTAVVA
jgi:hypothetical protein